MSRLRYDPAQRPGPLGLSPAIRRPVREDESEVPREAHQEVAVVPDGRGAGEERGGEPAATGGGDRAGAPIPEG